MAKSLKHYNGNPGVITRRLRGKTGGLGFLAAKDAERRLKAAKKAGKAAKPASQTRAELIQSGLLIPKEESTDSL